VVYSVYSTMRACSGTEYTAVFVGLCIVHALTFHAFSPPPNVLGVFLLPCFVTFGMISALLCCLRECSLRTDSGMVSIVCSTILLTWWHTAYRIQYVSIID
jgi:hypothetical protein